MRRTLLTSVLSLLVLGCASLAGPAAADEYPSRAIELVVGFAPGGGADNAARLIATYASQKLGQPVNVVNMPGASGITSTRQVLNSKPDGYTLFMDVHATVVDAVRGAERRAVSHGGQDPHRHGHARSRDLLRQGRFALEDR